MNTHVFIVLIPIVAIICVFTFVSIATWADARRKEREAYYKSETIKKIAESQSAGATAALELMREEKRIATRHAREGERIGGLVTIAVGISLSAFLWAVLPGQSKGVATLGLIPLLIGVALLAYSYLLASKEP